MARLIATVPAEASLVVADDGPADVEANRGRAHDAEARTSHAMVESLVSLLT
jgi:hypothetical protein